MLGEVDSHKVFCYRETKPHTGNHKERVEMKGHHAECAKIKPEKVVSSNCKKERKKVEHRNSNKYTLCNKKTYIGIF